MTAVQLSLLEHPGNFRTRWGIERWPLADLLAAERIDLDGPAWAAQAALRFGVTRRTVHRWRHHGLTTVAADEAACRVGLHPVLVWPTWCPAVTPDGDDDGLEMVDGRDQAWM